MIKRCNYTLLISFTERKSTGGKAPLHQVRPGHHGKYSIYIPFDNVYKRYAVLQITVGNWIKYVEVCLH